MSGKPSEGELVDVMKSSRSNFQKTLKKCKLNEDQIRRKKLLDNLKNKNQKEFWIEVNRIKKHNVNDAVVVDDEKDHSVICDIFSAKYKKILAKNEGSSIKNAFTSNSDQSFIKSKGQIFSMNDVKVNIEKLKPGIGNDGIHTNHFKFNSDLLTELVSKLFSSFVHHSYTPENLTDGTINPTVKDKFGDLSDSDNYRPVMMSSVILKLF